MISCFYYVYSLSRQREKHGISLRKYFHVKILCNNLIYVKSCVLKMLLKKVVVFNFEGSFFLKVALSTQKKITQSIISVVLRFTVSEYHLGIFKLFLFPARLKAKLYFQDLGFTLSKKITTVSILHFQYIRDRRYKMCI